MMVSSSGRINGNFHRPYNVTIFCPISGLLNDIFGFENVLPLPHLADHEDIRCERLTSLLVRLNIRVLTSNLTMSINWLV